MNKYETLFLIKPDLPEDQVQSVLDRLQTRIEGAQGKVAVIEHWGNRMLAYPVQYRGEQLRRGYYVLLTYGGDGRTVEEVERNIKINDFTFRYITVKLEDGFDPASVTEVQVVKRAVPSARPRRSFRGEEEGEAGRPDARDEERSAPPGEPLAEVAEEAGPSPENDAGETVADEHGPDESGDEEPDREEEE